MLSLLFRGIVGFSLGLTGGGGSIFAVPLLVYGLATPVHQAVVVSLAAVAATALGGTISHLRSGRIELKSALIFASAGIIGAPLGAWLGVNLAPRLILIGFAVLMLAVAVRLWWRAIRNSLEVEQGWGAIDDSDDSGPACRRDPQGALQLTARCTLVLLAAGVITGLLSGLFGVGGGFLIVPALLFAASLPIKRAAATSLLVIAIISAAGFLSHLLAGQPLNLRETILFTLGGLGGMQLGILAGQRIAGALLQKLVATMMVTVAMVMLVHNFL